MKKYLIVFLLSICSMFFAFANDSKIIFTLDTQISDITEILGEPNEIKIEEFPKHDYDSICYLDIEFPKDYI